MYLSAIIHDFGHKGVNNDYLIKTQDMLALRYNDRSPMENHHVSATWLLLKEERFNFLRKMPQKAVDVLRKQVIDMVLATDMKQVSWVTEQQTDGLSPATGWCYNIIFFVSSSVQCSIFRTTPSSHPSFHP